MGLHARSDQRGKDPSRAWGLYGGGSPRVPSLGCRHRQPRLWRRSSSSTRRSSLLVATATTPLDWSSSICCNVLVVSNRHSNKSTPTSTCSPRTSRGSQLLGLLPATTQSRQTCHSISHLMGSPNSRHSRQDLLQAHLLCTTGLMSSSHTRVATTRSRPS